MTDVQILVPGYVRSENGVEHASSTATLLKEGESIIVVDPGVDRGALLGSLQRAGLTPEQVTDVVLTHTHPDHALLAGLFFKARVFDSESIYTWDGSIAEHDGMIPETDISILKTPGHHQFHCSVIVPNSSAGTVAIVGDVFWWSDDEEQLTDKADLLDHADPYVKDPIALRKSREEILDMAQVVIPGHGKMFRVTP